jgi:hypothetical protein
MCALIEDTTYKMHSFSYKRLNGTITFRSECYVTMSVDQEFSNFATWHNLNF